MVVHWLEQVSGDVPETDDWLSSSEQLIFSGMKIPKRRADWRLGRWTAKCALTTYLELAAGSKSLATIEVRPAPTGAPEVFLDDQRANVSISLSHCHGTAACAVVPLDAVVGCDLELVESRNSAFIGDYFTTEEQGIIAQSPTSERDRLVTVLWSAKEGALKALRTGLRLDTRSVSAWLGVESLRRTEADLSSGTRSSTASYLAGVWSPLCVRYDKDQIFAGWWQCIDELVRTVVSVPSAQPPSLLTMGPKSATWQ